MPGGREDVAPRVESSEGRGPCGRIVPHERTELLKAGEKLEREKPAEGI